MGPGRRPTSQRGGEFWAPTGTTRAVARGSLEDVGTLNLRYL
jgi:hypothetical protein